MATGGQRAFPIVYVSDVRRSAAFYERLGFVPTYQHPPDGEPGFVNLRRAGAELGLVEERSPLELLGHPKGSGLRFELFVYVDDVDLVLASLGADVSVVRQPQDMPWGERLAYVLDPDGNPVALAAESA